MLLVISVVCNLKALFELRGRKKKQFVKRTAQRPVPSLRKIRIEWPKMGVEGNRPPTGI